MEPLGTLSEEDESGVLDLLTEASDIATHPPLRRINEGGPCCCTLFTLVY